MHGTQMHAIASVNEIRSVHTCLWALDETGGSGILTEAVATAGSLGSAAASAVRTLGPVCDTPHAFKEIWG